MWFLLTILYITDVNTASPPVVDNASLVDIPYHEGKVNQECRPLHTQEEKHREGSMYNMFWQDELFIQKM